MTSDQLRMNNCRWRLSCAWAWPAIGAPIIRKGDRARNLGCPGLFFYHLMIETPDGNLSKGMRQLNGVFTQTSNRRHGRSGHLFQERFKAILVDADSYLLELARHVVLNPVRAGMVRDPGKWPWSSYRAMVGDEPQPDWLATDGLLAAFAKRRADARKRYIRFVAEDKGVDSI